jgi:hypothetical protein
MIIPKKVVIPKKEINYVCLLFEKEYRRQERLYIDIHNLPFKRVETDQPLKENEVSIDNLSMTKYYVVDPHHIVNEIRANIFDENRQIIYDIDYDIDLEYLKNRLINIIENKKSVFEFNNQKEYFIWLGQELQKE